MLFLEKTSPPPFWQPQLTDKQRLMYDKAFIGNRSQAYYLKRFAQFDQAGRLTAKWHWAGFLMTFPWLLYRKRFLDSIVYSVAGWSFIQLNVTIILVAIEYLLIRNLDEAIRMPLRIGIGWDMYKEAEITTLHGLLGFWVYARQKGLSYGHTSVCIVC